MPIFDPDAPRTPKRFLNDPALFGNPPCYHEGPWVQVYHSNPAVYRCLECSQIVPPLQVGTRHPPGQNP